MPDRKPGREQALNKNLSAEERSTTFPQKYFHHFKTTNTTLNQLNIKFIPYTILYYFLSIKS
ncbi:hypothetical protein HDF19_09675 [Mucilaginibacter sp. E4BP6]|jgi:hypothetical protein|uniref:hypothetical protein n=1 Tax=Mucilaginibacter sp. E4BP6 TaxID=2723089 RepID=UPI0015CDF649|nr:hypothetical protein [Mucilaginibacter sp. E4BP6]NYE67746.1 hypothetical protein [Mucilaginibacter sp. E4BP6]